MKTSTRYSWGLRERALRPAHEHERDHDSQWAAVGSESVKIGCSTETLRK